MVKKEFEQSGCSMRRRDGLRTGKKTPAAEIFDAVVANRDGDGLCGEVCGEAFRGTGSDF